MRDTKQWRIFVGGHRGMVGSAIVRRLQASGHEYIFTKSRSELDLTNIAAVRAFLESEAIDAVYLAAARVGGIKANDDYPVDFIFDNLAIQNSVIGASHAAGIQHLLFLGSSCIYPKYAHQPISEAALLTGELEPTNEPYAIAKIAGIKLCESMNRQYGRDYRSVMPTNLYGPNDNYHPENSHVVAALIRRFHEARESSAPQVVVWGSGTPRREFLHVDDAASACLHVMQVAASDYARETSVMQSHINIGTGVDCTIQELAEAVAATVGYEGKILFDKDKPDGTPRKLLDVSLLSKLGWKSSIPLPRGLRDAYQYFVSDESSDR